MASSYPEVYYSNTIKTLFEAVPPFRPKPSFPPRPDKGGSCLFGALLIGGIICIIFGLASLANEEEAASVLLLGGLASVVVSIIATNISNNAVENKYKNSPEVRHYYESLARWEKERALELTSERLKEHRKRCFEEMGEFVYDPHVYLDISSRNEAIKKGASEDLLLEELLDFKDFFSIHGPLHLSFPRCSYYPDLVISDKENKILIAIEIDEPYTLEDHTPIHYLNEDGISVDGGRNDIFTSHGFCVIRFSEEQIIRNRTKCAMYILQILNYIRNGENTLPEPLPGLVQKKWTYEDAKRLADARHRESYLPSSAKTDLNVRIEDITVDKNTIIHRREHAAPEDDLPF
ncbi:MAG: hypothetical protein J6Y32_06695 [Bacteroidales bacterium]|nr:hypothetical protein [Bacteroidales bacterium]